MLTYKKALCVKLLLVLTFVFLRPIAIKSYLLVLDFLRGFLLGQGFSESRGSTNGGSVRQGLEFPVFELVGSILHESWFSIAERTLVHCKCILPLHAGEVVKMCAISTLDVPSCSCSDVFSVVFF